MRQPKPANAAHADVNLLEVMAFEQRLRGGLGARAARYNRFNRSVRAPQREHAAQAIHDLELAGLQQRITQRRRQRSLRMRAGMSEALGPHLPQPAAAERAATPAADPQPRADTVPERAAQAQPGSVLAATTVGAGAICILRVARPAGLSFRAGQHIKLGLPDSAGSEGPKNPYTIASAPSEPHLEFCIERVPGGRLSPRLCSLQPGARVSLDERSQAKGDFLLAPDADVHLMFATVTGISPFRSMLRDVAARGAWSSRFVILHGASFGDELVYQEELQALAQRFPQRVRYLASVSRPSDPRNRGFSGLSGRVANLAPGLASELMRELAAGGHAGGHPSNVPSRIQAYACGNPEMVTQVHRALGALGLAVRSEVFD